MVHALRGKEFVEPNNPYDVGLTGLLGMPAGYHALMDADAILMLGYRLSVPTVFPRRRPRGAGRYSRPSTLAAAPASKLAWWATWPKPCACCCRTHPAHRQRPPEEAQERHREDTAHLAELATGEAGDTSLHPQHVARLLDELAADDAIFTCDVGTPTIWAARYLSMNGRRRLIGLVHARQHGQCRVAGLWRGSWRSPAGRSLPCAATAAWPCC